MMDVRRQQTSAQAGFAGRREAAHFFEAPNRPCRQLVGRTSGAEPDVT